MKNINDLLNDVDPFPQDYNELKNFLFNKYKHVSILSLKKHIEGLEESLSDNSITIKEKSQIKDFIRILNELINQKTKK